MYNGRLGEMAKFGAMDTLGDLIIITIAIMAILAIMMATAIVTLNIIEKKLSVVNKNGK